MQNVPIDGLILIRENGEVSGLQIWSYFINKALNTNFDVTIVLFLHLKENLPTNISNKANVLELFDTTSLEETFAEFLNNSANKSVIFIDSLDFLLQRFDFTRIIRLLSNICDSNSALICVVEQKEEYLKWKALEHISKSTLTLNFLNRSLICRTRTKKKDGLVSDKVEKYEFKKGELTSSAYEPVLDHPIGNDGKESSRTSNEEKLLNSLPFDVGLNLSSKERLAKRQVQLPYVKAQNETGLVGLNISSGKKIRAGGQILYTPDKEDDFDDSDPDDDLMI